MNGIHLQRDNARVPLEFAQSFCNIPVTNLTMADKRNPPPPPPARPPPAQPAQPSPAHRVTIVTTGAQNLAGARESWADYPDPGVEALYARVDRAPHPQQPRSASATAKTVRVMVGECELPPVPPEIAQKLVDWVLALQSNPTATPRSADAPPPPPRKSRAPSPPDDSGSDEDLPPTPPQRESRAPPPPPPLSHLQRDRQRRERSPPPPPPPQRESLPTPQTPHCALCSSVRQLEMRKYGRSKVTDHHPTAACRNILSSIDSDSEKGMPELFHNAYVTTMCPFCAHTHRLCDCQLLTQAAHAILDERNERKSRESHERDHSRHPPRDHNRDRSRSPPPQRNRRDRCNRSRSPPPPRDRDRDRSRSPPPQRDRRDRDDRQPRNRRDDRHDARYDGHPPKRYQERPPRDSNY
jgi:hypothetical protein